jgi:hypothetical protein
VTGADLAADLDRWLPPRGPCLICGVPGMDARHRTIDAIVDYIGAGSTPGEVADDLALPIEAVRAALAWRNRPPGAGRGAALTRAPAVC